MDLYLVQTKIKMLYICSKKTCYTCYKTHESLTQYWIYAQHVVFLSATKTLDVLLGTGFMRSTKRATFLGLLYFQMLIISIITFSMYAISRTIQNISFNTPYDLTTRIKSLICKITRFYMKIFVTSSYGTLNGISMIFPCITKNNPCPFSGRKFFVF